MITCERISNIRLLSARYDKVYLIVRSLGKRNLIVANNIIHLPVLSPSWNLFTKYLDACKQKQFSEQWFKDVYVKQFLSEMQQCKDALNKLYQEAQTENIAIACYCKEENLCHRSIIMGLLQGAEKEQGKKITHCSTDYSFYYEQFKTI